VGGYTAGDIASAYPKMADYASEVVRVAAKIGIPPEWLANVIYFESGGNPQARNTKSSATGLIQFISSTAASLGTSVDALYRMSGREQMAYVDRYFAPKAGKLGSQEDVYMAVFYPKAVGNPDYRFPASVTKSNPGIYTPRDYAAMANRKAKLTPYVGAAVAEELVLASQPSRWTLTTMAPWLGLFSVTLLAGALIYRHRFRA
jgi:hypothetical protein